MEFRSSDREFPLLWKGGGGGGGGVDNDDAKSEAEGGVKWLDEAPVN